MTKYIFLQYSNSYKKQTNLIKAHTVKLGYNELGYNEHSVIPNKKFSPK